MYTFDAELWLYDGDAAWHFVTLPPDISDDIEARTIGLRRGFGSVRVRVTVGNVTWSTSVFPDKRRAAFILPIKKDVRSKEDLQAGDRLEVALQLL